MGPTINPKVANTTTQVKITFNTNNCFSLYLAICNSSVTNSSFGKEIAIDE